MASGCDNPSHIWRLQESPKSAYDLKNINLIDNLFDPPSVLAGRLGLDSAEGLEVEIDANGRMMLMDRRFDA